jgi:hypothetical protein
MHIAGSNRAHAEARADGNGKANAEGLRSRALLMFFIPTGTCRGYAMGDATTADR